LDDEDDKLVLAPPGKEYTDEQILALTEFQEQFFKPVVQREKFAHRVDNTDVAIEKSNLVK
jgi:inorganic pyrophosphatase